MDNKLVLIIVSLLLPPLAVGLKKGVGKDLAINVLLCVLMWVPGVIHALWVVTRRADAARAGMRAYREHPASFSRLD